MSQRGSTLMRPFVILALPGMYLLYKYNQYRQQQMETARRRVTERELMQLNNKILCVQKSGNPCDERHDYAKSCRRALKDIPPVKDPVCPKPCPRHEPRKNKILHKIKLKIIEGGTNFGAPFRKILPKPEEDKKKKPDKRKQVATLPVPQKPRVPKKVEKEVNEPHPGIQISILGAETEIGTYLALLLKQCPIIKKLRLYEATVSECNRDICTVACDLSHIDTTCGVQAFCCDQLERCLQNTDIVVMLDTDPMSTDCNQSARFYHQAPYVKKYADAIAAECPKAFVIVCATPIDCTVPLVAEIFKETGWYDPRKLLGSMSVPEMRATTLAAKALGLDPKFTRVPCVGGSEGYSLVPLFSKAIEGFEFPTKHAAMMTETVRCAQIAAEQTDTRAASLSEAHALAKLVFSVCHALLCNDCPIVSGFVETDASLSISPARFIATPVKLGREGITKTFGLPKLTPFESSLVVGTLEQLAREMWFLAIDVALNRHGIYKRFDFPPRITEHEVYLLTTAFEMIKYNISLAMKWRDEVKMCMPELEGQLDKPFLSNLAYERIEKCVKYMV